MTAPTDVRTRAVTLRELLDAMAHLRDDEVFRWYQTSRGASDGGIHAGDTLCLTIGQVRRELAVLDAVGRTTAIQPGEASR